MCIRDRPIITNYFLLRTNQFSMFHEKRLARSLAHTNNSTIHPDFAPPDITSCNILAQVCQFKFYRVFKQFFYFLIFINLRMPIHLHHTCHLNCSYIHRLLFIIYIVINRYDLYQTKHSCV